MNAKVIAEFLDLLAPFLLLTAIAMEVLDSIVADQGPFLRSLDPIKRRQLEVLCCGTPCVNSWPF